MVVYCIFFFFDYRSFGLPVSNIDSNDGNNKNNDIDTNDNNIDTINDNDKGDFKKSRFLIGTFFKIQMDHAINYLLYFFIIASRPNKIIFKRQYR